MTRFQKVASALRGGGAERDEQDPAAASPPWVTEEDKAPMANSPISRETHPHGDYWDEPGAGRDEAVAVTSPGVPFTHARPDTADHTATEPDMFGTTTHAGNGTLRPGEAAGRLGDFSDLTYGNLIPDAAVYSEQWQHIQFRFVDDPRASVTEAADIVAQVAAKMESAIQERQRAIEERQRAIAERQRSLRGRWGEGANADTEALRETLRMYKAFLDQLIGPKAS